MSKFVDFGPTHRHISDSLFGGQGWVYNGSACSDRQQRLHYVCRARDMRGRALSHVVYQSFDEESLTPLSPPTIVAVPTASNTLDSGPQDARIFQRDDQCWIVFNMLCADGFRRMHLGNLSATQRKFVPLKIGGKDYSAVEKNWTPFVLHDRIFFIYSFAPLVLLSCDETESGNCRVVYTEPASSSRPFHYRGGSPAIAVAGNATFVGWLHTVAPIPIDSSNYNATALPIPAQKTPHVYRSQRYELHWNGGSKPKLVIDGEERVFFGNQIEQVYGQTQQGLIVNVDDRYTIYVKN